MEIFTYHIKKGNKTIFNFFDLDLEFENTEDKTLFNNLCDKIVKEMNTEYPTLTIPFQGRRDINEKLDKDNVVNIFFNKS